MNRDKMKKRPREKQRSIHLFVIIIISSCFFVTSLILFVQIYTQSFREKDIETEAKKAFPYFGTSHLNTSSFKPKGKYQYLEWKDGETPYTITENVRIYSDSLARDRKTHIKAAMKHAWKGYRACAFGRDEVSPASCGWKTNELLGATGATLLDSLDTLWLMDMKEEFNEARDWIKDNLHFDADVLVSTFETTIRNLGGLLSAYDWSGDSLFLDKAVDLGNRLIKVFDTPMGIPWSHINLKTGEGRNGFSGEDSTTIAEVGSLQVEFRFLSEVTQNPIYAAKAESAFDVLRSLQSNNGMYLTNVVNTKKVRDPKLLSSGDYYTFSGKADSFFEYMLKIWLQGGKREEKYRVMYDDAIEGLHKEILAYTNGPAKLAYIAEKYSDGKLKHTFDHLECFLGGLLALGAHTDPLGPNSEHAARDMKTAKAITYTCYQMYAINPTGLGADVIFAYTKRKKKEKKGKSHRENVEQTKDHISDFSLVDFRYQLRPEAIESLYILNKLTGDPIYREWGWEIFQSIEKFCKLPYGYGSFQDVRNVNSTALDEMQSFFLAETLKYLYLLMDPDSEVDLETHVFNTEAHPLRKFDVIDNMMVSSL